MNYQKKIIDGYEKYQIDTKGVIYNENGTSLSYNINHNGYYIIVLHNKYGKAIFGVHTLVAKSFIPNPKNKPTVNHIDGNKRNNHVENLEWATYEEQMYHAVHTLGFKPNINNYKPVVGINKKTNSKVCFESLASAARFLNNNMDRKYTRSDIWRVTTHQRKSCGGYRWYYKAEYDENIKNKYVI